MVRARSIARSSGGASQPATLRSLRFSKVWFVAAGGVLLAGMWAGSAPVTLLGALILSSTLIGRFWNQAMAGAIRVERRLESTRAFPGDTIMLEISVVNRKPVPVPWVAVEDELSDGLVPEGVRSMTDATTGRRIVTLTTSLRPYQRITWHIPVICRARGAHRIGPATLRTGDPFGLFGSRERQHGDQELLVYPRIRRLAMPPLPMERPQGEGRARRAVIRDPLRIEGIRDYRPEDPFRAIHWKATARHSEIQVKIEEPAASLSMLILLDLDTFDHYWEGIDLSRTEQAIEIASSIAAWAMREKHPVGLRSNGMVSGSDQPLAVPIGRGPAQEERLMTGLARIWPYSTAPFAPVLESGLRRAPLGSTIVLVTPKMSDAMAARLRGSIDQGQQVVVVPVGDGLEVGILGATVLSGLIDSGEESGLGAVA
jgi:uncharacterized protein (DUF58 family)